MNEEQKVRDSDEIARLEAVIGGLRAEKQAHADEIASYRAIFEMVPVGLVVTDETGRILHGNSEMEEMVRHPIFQSEGSSSYDEWESYHEDGTRVRTEEYPLAKVIDEGTDRAELTVHYKRGDDTRFWMQIIGESVRDGDGKVIGAVVACVDMDEERGLRAAQDVLIKELNHRVKNAFTVSNAIVGRSLRSSDIDPALRKTIDKRLSAYAKAHAKLVGTDWRRAPIEDLARDVLEPIGDSRIRISGDSLTVPTRMALAFSMAFYELATNAVKYGSLSREEGYVDLSWRKERRDAAEIVFLDWVERGGPEPEKDVKAGFGSFVTGRALIAETRGRISTDYSSKGFEWHLEFPANGEEQPDD